MDLNELKQEAKKYLAEHSEYSEIFGETFVAVDTLTAMVDFAESKEKRIAELERNVAYYAERAKHAELDGRDYVLKNKDLGKRCLQLQKDKGNLTDRVRELEQQIEQAENGKVVEHFEAYGQCRDSRRIAELEKENAELNETLGKCAKTPVLYCLGEKETINKAKEIIKNLMVYVPVDLKEYEEAKVFLNGEACPDCFCEDCPNEDCEIKKLGLVEVEK